MHQKTISIADYSYDLPSDSIANYPLAERDASRLLIYRAADAKVAAGENPAEAKALPGEGHAGAKAVARRNGIITEDTYRNIADHLPPRALLVFNNTKVVEARIVFQKPTGGQIEIFCLEPPADYGGMAAALSRTGCVRWKCLIGGASKWKPGQVLAKILGDDGVNGVNGAVGAGDGGALLEARWIERSGDTFIIELSWTPAELSFAELLHRAGRIPLPPYIHRSVETTDSERYQTVYARHEGSVAAPTAGLHFTDAIFTSLAKREIGHAYVTLHVGAGTFLPVKAEMMGEHHMHIEFLVVNKKTIVDILQTIKSGKPVIAVGTTSARTLESLYWLGKKVMVHQELEPEALGVEQWEAYEDAVGGPDTIAALTALSAWMDRLAVDELLTTTQLLIAPGYIWRVVSGLVTNFHQPESTLLLLVASLIGKDWRDLYAYALEHGFRFLSYGDGCLLLPGTGA